MPPQRYHTSPLDGVDDHAFMLFQSDPLPFPVAEGPTQYVAPSHRLTQSNHTKTRTTRNLTGTIPKTKTREPCSKNLPFIMSLIDQEACRIRKFTHFVLAACLYS